VIHSFIGDLSIAVVSPAGTRVVLRDRAGAGADDLHETWTPATTPALSDPVDQPFAGRWTLHLTDHAGQDTGRLDRWRLEVDPTGTWTLHVRDVAALDTGRLLAWSLRLST
jgi:subtilisin-like proprotein convertase family protein